MVTIESEVEVDLRITSTIKVLLSNHKIFIIDSQMMTTEVDILDTPTTIIKMNKTIESTI